LSSLNELFDSFQRNDLDQIREHYLGLKKEKKKIQKPSEKFRNVFTFDWNPVEDTTKNDTNDLYKSRVEPQLLFGRGFRAGIDVR
jgi:ATP-dependent RNA helicase DDX23/PRP28